MRIIDADDFYKPFEEAKKTLEAIGSALPEELLDGLLKIYDEIKERLDATPTIEPPTTTWLGDFSPYTCKHCGYHVDSKTRYCPDCGRRAAG